MFAFLTHVGLRLLRHGCGAPLWRSLVTLENAVCVNAFSAVVVAVSVTYAVKKLFFQLGPKDDPKESPKAARIAPWLTGLPFLVLPLYVDQLAGLSPFFFSLVPSSLSLALVASLCRKPRPLAEEGGRRLVGLRLFLAGALAAVGAWEGVQGIAAALVVLVLATMPWVRRSWSVSRQIFMWVVGCAVAFMAEGLAFGWPWGAFRPYELPMLGLALSFAVVAVIPVVLVRTIGETPWLLTLWGGVLVMFSIVALVGGRYSQEGGCERFVKRVLSELGGRKIIIADGFTDDFFRELKPADVRLVGMTSAEDREFLILSFGEREAVTNKALVVRHYHGLPEMEAAAAELGLVRRQPVASGSEKPIAPERIRADAAESALAGIREAMETLQKLSADERRAKADEVRAKIRSAWACAVKGVAFSSFVLALDVLLGDRVSAESDALTALTIDREDPAGNAMLGSLRLETGEYDRAERYLRKGVKGGGAGAYNDLALLLVKTGRAAEADAWARKAVTKAPDDWNFRETLVQVLIALGRKDEARKELTLVEKLATDRHQIERVRPQITRDRLILSRTP